jgi:hypothetical protein
MKKCFLLIVAANLVIISKAQHEHSDSARPVNNEQFNLIKTLAGNWKGSFKWIGRASEGEMDARYYFTGNGTAVVEDLISEGNIVMTSVYHPDGPDLRVTHYCAAGNQPRLKAKGFDSENRSINFEMVDITNLQSPDAAHVHGLELKLKDADHLKIIFRFIKSGVESLEQIDLTRLNN